MDSPQDSLDMKSVQISEAPNSKDHLDALFEVLVSQKDQQPKTQPMIDRKLPKSFYDASAPDKTAGLRLGPSINVGPPPPGGPNEHLRSYSMPARMDHSRQYPEGSLGPLPSGWEAAKTPDGINYFIDHNMRATTWEDPRKVHQGRSSIHQLPPGAPHPPMPPYPHHNQSQHMQQQHPFHQPPPPPPPHQPLEATSSLPDGWQKAFTAEGEPYYVNHKNRTTSWFHPAIPQHNHSHSYAPGMARGIPMPAYSAFTQQQQQQQQHNSLIQHQLHAEKRQYEVFHQSMASGGGNDTRVPATLYSDPYLSSSHVRQASHDSALHVRQASHDSGLGAPGLPYQSEVMEFDEGMEVTSSVQSSKSSFSSHPPSNRPVEYVDGMNSLGVDSVLPESQQMMTGGEQPMPEQMEELDRLAWV